MKIYRKHIAEIIAGLTGENETTVERLLEYPPSHQKGDLAFPCFSLAKSLRKPPKAIAEELKEKISADQMIEKSEASGPYLNFFINRNHLISDVLNKVNDENSDYGKSDVGRGRTIAIEYSAPNIAKPFGIQHLRSTVIGASLTKIFKHLGYKTIGINHLGDWGTQFGKLILAYKRWGDDARLNENPIGHLYDIYVKIHQEEENNTDITEQTRAEFKKLEQGDPENLSLWKRFSDLSKKEFGKIYKILNVSFDYDLGESFYVDKIPDLEQRLERSGLLLKSQEATVVDLEKYDMPPVLIRKRDDTSLYAARDLAAAIYRKETYNFDKMVYVVGVAQSLYFKQLFKALELMGFDWADDCHHVGFGWIKMGEEMMSTRRGNLVFLEDVLNKTIEKAKKIIEDNSPDLKDPESVAFAVGIGAVIFADLSCKRDADISFDWDKMLDFRGNSGPYIQYTHARICSIIRKYGKELSGEFNARLLTLPEEFAIAKMLSRYPDIILRASKEFDPYYISIFLLELCGIFNTYYQKYRSPKDRVLSSDDELSESRVALVNCTRTVLFSGMDLLGISAPEMM